MDALGVALVSAGIALVLGAYSYTFIIDNRHTKRMEAAEENWAERADAKTLARDAQVQQLRADAMAAISNNNVSLFEQRLHAATTFATVKQLEQMETRFSAMIGKVEAKVDRLTDLIKNGKH